MAQDEDTNPWAHCMVVWGNLLYEHSQFRSAVGGDWRTPLEQAYKNFRAAGCPESDIRTAMGAHARSKDVDFMEEAEEKDQGSAEKDQAATAQENGQVRAMPALQYSTWICDLTGCWELKVRQEETSEQCLCSVLFASGTPGRLLTTFKISPVSWALPSSQANKHALQYSCTFASRPMPPVQASLSSKPALLLHWVAWI